MHEFSVLLGHSIQSTRWDKNESSKQGFPTDNIYEMDGGTQNDKVTGSAEEASLQSFFGRVNYNYGGRYLFEMNMRRDGSSRMPKKTVMPTSLLSREHGCFLMRLSCKTSNSSIH